MPFRFSSIRLQLAAVAAAAAAVYLNTLGHGFVYDDLLFIVANPWIRDGALVEIVSSPAWGFAGVDTYYRPLINLIYAVEHALFGFEPWGWHLVNVLFHAGCSALVVTAVRAAGGRLRANAPTSGPFVAGLLFAVHPIHTEVVAWVSGLQDLAFSAFGLAAFVLWTRDGGRALWGSAAAFLAAMLCKESAAALVPILLARDILAGKVVGFSGLVRRWSPWAIAAVAYLGLRVWALGALLPGTVNPTWTGGQAVAAVPILLARYLGKLVWPFGLNAAPEFGPERSLGTATLLVSLLVTVALAVALVALAHRHSVAALGLAWIPLALAPVLWVPALGDHAFAERYLYFPSVGLALLAGHLWDRVRAGVRTRSPRSRAAVAVAILVAVACAMGTIRRNLDWADSLTLWRATVDASPEAPRPRNNLGRALHLAGRTDEAIAEFRRALEIHPDHVDAWVNLGLALADRGDLRGARDAYLAALERDESEADAWANLGGIYVAAGDLARARRATDRALESDPRHPEALNNRGNLELMAGRPQPAIEAYRASLAIQPDRAETRFNLAIALMESGRPERAAEELRRVIALRPDDAEAQRLLSEVELSARPQ